MIRWVGGVVQGGAPVIVDKSCGDQACRCQVIERLGRAYLNSAFTVRNGDGASASRHALEEQRWRGQERTYVYARPFLFDEKYRLGLLYLQRMAIPFPM